MLREIEFESPFAVKFLMFKKIRIEKFENLKIDKVKTVYNAFTICDVEFDSIDFLDNTNILYEFYINKEGKLNERFMFPTSENWSSFSSYTCIESIIDISNISSEEREFFVNEMLSFYGIVIHGFLPGDAKCSERVLMGLIGEWKDLVFVEGSCNEFKMKSEDITLSYSGCDSGFYYFYPNTAFETTIISDEIRKIYINNSKFRRKKLIKETEEMIKKNRIRLLLNA